ncbi:aldo/keto reductase [Bradyrhizobium sp. 146]|uniref:aldo/keto reductase n=1 Tax=Bradyrhizobium sp. 146 TaxID=2782622 RepID=UPI001FF9B36A|nr:aldo/keto reductase [Bradyrhizobium sp. 146]MCK1707599.1 aldo/keto reductase [Bradyrhizobium sp. 146]
MTARDDITASLSSRIGLGTVQFGANYGVSNVAGQVPTAQVAAILRSAHAAGVRLLDTAASYGTAEEVLGSALAPDQDFAIVTKALPLSHGLEEVERRARRSLDLLGRAPADAILIHAARDLAGPEGLRLWALLERLRDEGLYRRIGISAYFADGPLELARRYRPDLMQLPFSILDQRLRENGELAQIKQLGIEIHVRSVFLQGLLFMDPGQLPGRLAHAGPALAKAKAHIRQAGLRPIEAAIGFVLAQQDVDIAVVGVTSRNELAQIVAASATPFPDLDWRTCAIDDSFILTPSLW